LAEDGTMSEATSFTEVPDGPNDSVAAADQAGVPVPLREFAVELGPKVIAQRGARPRRQAAHADQVYLKLLKTRHGRERHSIAGWRALIDTYRHQPAHRT
jgi:hypothetical protein